MNEKKNILSFLLAAVLFAIFAAVIAGLFNDIYQKYWWSDNVLHFAGGFWVFVLYLWLFENKKILKKPDWPKFAFLIAGVCFTALIGVMWEFAELIAEYFSAAQAMVGFPISMELIDTLTDLFMDLSGALFSGIILLYLLKIEKPW